MLCEHSTVCLVRHTTLIYVCHSSFSFLLWDSYFIGEAVQFAMRQTADGCLNRFQCLVTVSGLSMNTPECVFQSTRACRSQAVLSSVRHPAGFTVYGFLSSTRKPRKLRQSIFLLKCDIFSSSGWYVVVPCYGWNVSFHADSWDGRACTSLCTFQISSIMNPGLLPCSAGWGHLYSHWTRYIQEHTLQTLPDFILLFSAVGWK